MQAENLNGEYAMQTIRRFELDRVTRETTIRIPEGSRIVHFSAQPMDPAVWILFDPEMPTLIRCLGVFATDTPVNNDWEYVASTEDGKDVWHLFQM